MYAHDRTGGASVEVHRCRTCGIGFADADEGAPAAPTALPSGGIARRIADAILWGELKPARAIIGDGERVLDVGAGSGNRSVVLARHGHLVDVVEPDPDEAAMARRQLGDRATVHKCTIEALPQEIADYDVALFSHVVEHLPDPEITLAATRARLRSGGHVVVMVPNAGGIEARLFRGRWHGWEPSRHRWHFRRAVLAETLRRAGFEEVQVRATGGWRYPSTLAFSIAPGLDPQINPARALAGRLLTTALIPVARLLTLTGAGAQLVAVGRAPGSI